VVGLGGGKRGFHGGVRELMVYGLVNGAICRGKTRRKEVQR
jgi:hypothetical protein